MAILNFTYALCYNYYNWNDAIKTPAPCMLADKIAGFRSEVGTIPSNVDLHKLPFYLWALYLEILFMNTCQGLVCFVGFILSIWTTNQRAISHDSGLSI